MITCFIDVETTGLDPKAYSIIQLSGIIRNGEEEKSFDFRIKPYKNETITESASSKTGLTQEIIETYPDQIEAYNAFMSLLKEFGVGSSYKNKAYFVGYNSDFDMSFLRDWFEFNNNTRFGYYFWWPDIDVARMAALYFMGGRHLIGGFKLVDVYRYIFNEDFENAHDAMSDIMATKRLFEFFATKFLFEPMEKEKI